MGQSVYVVYPFRESSGATREDALKGWTTYEDATGLDPVIHLIELTTPQFAMPTTRSKAQGLATSLHAASRSKKAGN